MQSYNNFCANYVVNITKTTYFYKYSTIMVRRKQDTWPCECFLLIVRPASKSNFVEGRRRKSMRKFVQVRAICFLVRSFVPPFFTLFLAIFFLVVAFFLSLFFSFLCVFLVVLIVIFYFFISCSCCYLTFCFAGGLDDFMHLFHLRCITRFVYSVYGRPAVRPTDGITDQTSDRRKSTTDSDRHHG